MKLFSEYIIMEADYTERNQKIKDKLINIFYILQLNDVISLSSNEELTTAYNELVKQCKTALNKILVNTSKLDKVLNTKFDILLKNYFEYSKNKATEFDKLTGDIQEKIKAFINKLDNLKSEKNESLNEAEDNSSENIDKLKAELEKIKDVKFEDEDNNFYKIGLRLIDNYEAFKDTMSDDDKAKLDKKIEKLISDIKALSDTEKSDNTDSEEETNQEEQIEQTETKVIESKYIEGLKKGIPELEKIEDDELFKVFKKYVPDEAKDEPDGKEYLGLTILTLGAIILKSISTDNYKTHIQNITKKDEA